MLKVIIQILKSILLPKPIQPKKSIEELNLPKVDLSKIKGGQKQVIEEKQNSLVEEIKTLQPKPKFMWLLDNGHGSLTNGKRSPVLEDGERFFEYAYNRKNRIHWSKK